MVDNKPNKESNVGSFTVKSGLAQMLKGGVIMDVVSAEQAVVAEEAGAVAVMALERVPADIREHGGQIIDILPVGGCGNGLKYTGLG